ncbi:hypothetical protein C8F01DRAFT_1206810 [Mycena amicta]|nr:hypothetical protein C8F01DRAFT_1206810 [Mycena amicta]
MSAETIARWNAIPMAGEPRSLKVLAHPRPRSIPDDDDDISLVSRSPSPPPMDVDQDPYKYDEYVSRPIPEVITVETKIKPSNKGFAMLAKLGWREGEPLGLSGEGTHCSRVDPVPFQIKQDSLGLGRLTQDIRMIETTVSQRRDMDSERMTRESEEQRKAREDQVARRSILESELSSAIQAFYCELCDKQFKNVAAYTEHTNSYAHHHKARFKDMQSSMRGTHDDAEKRKERERKIEERSLRKIAAAKGIKLTKPPAAVVSPTPAGSSRGDMDIDGGPISTGSVKSSGWTTGSTTSGWTPIDAGSLPTSETVPPPQSPPPLPAIVPPQPQAPPVEEPVGKAHAARLGWQQFQKKRR